MRWPADVLKILPLTAERDFLALALSGSMERVARIPMKTAQEEKPEYVSALHPNEVSLNASISSSIVSLLSRRADDWYRVVYRLFLQHRLRINPLYRARFWGEMKKQKEHWMHLPWIAGQMDAQFIAHAEPSLDARVWRMLLCGNESIPQLPLHEIHDEMTPLLIERGVEPTKMTKRTQRAFEKKYHIPLSARNVDLRTVKKYLRDVSVVRVGHRTHLTFDLDMPEQRIPSSITVLPYFLSCHSITHTDFRRAQVTCSVSSLGLYQKLLIELTLREGIAKTSLAWSQLDFDWEYLDASYDPLLLPLYGMFPAYQLPELPQRISFPILLSPKIDLSTLKGAVALRRTLSSQHLDIQQDVIDTLLMGMILSCAPSEIDTLRTQLNTLFSDTPTSYPFRTMLNV
ncbi:MAG: hypothetical protein VX278_17230, partial [Myxococcota bacterium]|nr:hypothetical protein [Myxococcota bacterium]